MVLLNAVWWDLLINKLQATNPQLGVCKMMGSFAYGVSNYVMCYVVIFLKLQNELVQDICKINILASMPLTFSIHHVLVLTRATSGNIFKLSKILFLGLQAQKEMDSAHIRHFTSPHSIDVGLWYHSALSEYVNITWILMWGVEAFGIVRIAPFFADQLVTWGARCKVSRGIVIPSDIVIVLVMMVLVSSDVEMYGGVDLHGDGINRMVKEWCVWVTFSSCNLPKLVNGPFDILRIGGASSFSFVVDFLVRLIRAQTYKSFWIWVISIWAACVLSTGELVMRYYER